MRLVESAFESCDVVARAPIAGQSIAHRHNRYRIPGRELPQKSRYWHRSLAINTYLTDDERTNSAVAGHDEAVAPLAFFWAAFSFLADALSTTWACLSCLIESWSSALNWRAMSLD